LYHNGAIKDNGSDAGSPSRPQRTGPGQPAFITTGRISDGRDDEGRSELAYQPHQALQLALGIAQRHQREGQFVKALLQQRA
jgi:hypothetical protein